MSQVRDATRPVTANDRLKRRFSRIWWNSLSLAVVAHFLLFAFFPRLTAADIGETVAVTSLIDVPPPIDIPPTPERIARPATPVASATVDVNVTIEPTTIEAYTAEQLAPPPAGTGSDPSLVPHFVPTTVRPELRNRADVERALERLYPSMLRDAGIGGVAHVWFYISETGSVVRTMLNESSGHDGLDDAALKVADVMRFSPAYNRDRAVAVWVSVPIRFNARMP